MSSVAQVSPRKQDGIVVLVLVILIAMSTIGYFLNEFSPGRVKHQQKISTGQSLSRAKDALLAYAVSRADVATPSAQPGRLGYLPCPANNNGEGNSVGNCGAQNEAALGWFPWRSLGLPPLRDESGACLLYAVSGSYKFSPPPDMLNEDSYGMFQVVDENLNVVQGINPEDRVVAIIFAPGSALPGQTRVYNAGSQCGDDVNNFGAYLDTFVGALGTIDNSDVTTGIEDRIDQFIRATQESISNGVVNDRFITITRDEIWSAILRRVEFDPTDVSGNSSVRRVTEALARCLAQYGNDNANSRLPYPAPVDFNGNDYRDRDDYDDAPAIAGGGHFGRFPYIVDSADLVIPGTISNNRLFNKSFSAPPVHLPPNDIRECNDLRILFSPGPPDPPGPNADLRTLDSEDRVYWENRKDHFFYAVSNSYRPSNLPLDDSAGAPRCGSCISVNGVQYAAAVIYSGEERTQSREAPIAPSDTSDTKSNWVNYVEFSGITGDGTSSYDSTGNDLMFCITDTEPLAVVPCP
jgi:hypothetical protein